MANPASRAGAGVHLDYEAVEREQHSDDWMAAARVA
jgi:hypothetical protein